ncbi:MAG: tetratricopeptide repeat-containing sensor histidine kinase [Ferruginibacter sp.]
MKRILFLLLAINFSIISVNAQQAYVDSLKNITVGEAPIEKKINAWLLLSDYYATRNFDESWEAAHQGITLASKKSDSSSLAILLKQLGRAYYFKGNFDSAAIQYHKAIEITDQSNFMAIKADVLNELGKLYRKTRDLARAKNHYDDALKLYQSLKDENGMATIYNESGVVYEYENDFKEAIRRYQLSLAIREKTKDSIGIGYSLNFIGTALTQQGNFIEAEKYLNKTLLLRQQLQDSFTIALTLTDLGALYTSWKKYDVANQKYIESNGIATRIKYPDLLLNNYRELSSIAEHQGNSTLSLNYYKTYNAIKDSLFSVDKMKQIESLEAKYQTRQKVQQLQLQQLSISRKNYLIGSLIAGFLVFSLIAFGVYKRKQIRAERKLQLEIIKQQDLATKAVLDAEENERKRIAADLHDGVGQLMSVAKMNLSKFETELPFNNQQQKINFLQAIDLVDESCKEIRSISHQMMPNALLKKGLSLAVKDFIDKIDNRVIHINLHTEGLNESLDSSIETVLYRVIQEGVNNVIKHAQASRLDISLIKEDDGISVTIEDNGIGFDTANTNPSAGIGLKNINSRVEFLKGSVDFDTAPGKGTLLAIYIPLKK